MKKIISIRFFALCLVLCISMMSAQSVFAASDESAKTEVAVAVLGNKVMLDGFEMVETGTGGVAEVTVQGGSECWLLNKNAGTSKGYLNMNLSPSFKKENDGSVYTIEIEYYDVSNGYFRLSYDRKNYENKIGTTFYMSNAATWKTASFTVDDAAFENGVDGKYDIQISIFAPSSGTSVSPSSIAVRKVTVKKQVRANPVYLTSETEQSGNAWEWYSKNKKINNEFQNFSSETKNVDITHSFVNNYGLKVFEKHEKMTLLPGEKVASVFDFSELERCDLYWYTVAIEDEEKTFNSVFKPFEVAVLKTDPDGITNEYVYFAEHIDRVANTNEKKKNAWDVFKLGNFGGARGGGLDEWSYSYENAKGVFRCQSDTTLAKNLKEKTGDYIVTVSGNSPRYGSWNSMPNTEEELEDWRLYVRAMATACNGYFDKFEIWNEPNITNFNHRNVRGDGYMKLFNIAYEEIKKVNPNAIVFGPCITGPHVEMGWKYYDETLENGLWKQADGISIHPYATTTIERNTNVSDAVLDFKRKFEEKSGREPLVYLTELGYSRADSPIGGNSRRLGIYNARSVLFYEGREIADMLTFHKFDDNGVVATDHEDMFGHVSTGKETKYNTLYVPYESYAIMTGLNYVMAKTKPYEVLDMEDEDIYISRFKSEKFDSDILTVYSLDVPKTVTFKLDCDTVRVFDEFGNETKVSGKDGCYSILAGQAPTYIVGGFSKVEILKDNCFEYGEGKLNIARNEIITKEIEMPDNGKYEVELNVPESVEILSISDLPNGKKQFKLKNNGNIGDICFVEVKILSNGNVVSVGEYEIETIASIVSKMDVELKSSSDLSSWLGKIQLKNESYESAAIGKIVFSEPYELSDKEINIGIIPSKKTGEVNFTLPKISKLGQRTFKYKIELNDGTVYEDSEKISFSVSPYASKKPVIDGVLEEGEWPATAAMYADEQGQTKQLENWTKEDVSARLMVMWDEENMYIACEVIDDVHCNIQNPEKNWNGDNLQFGVFYGDAAYLAVGQGGGSYHEISMSLNSETNQVSVWRYKSQEDVYPAGLVTDAECKIVRNEAEKKTIYEFSMPWSKLLRPGDKPAEGQQVGFSYVINETDSGTRQGWIEYSGGIAESKDTSLFSYMTLIK